MSGMPRFMGMAIIFLQLLAVMSFGQTLSQTQVQTAPSAQTEVSLFSRIAPEQCVFYMSYDGTVLRNASTTNQTGKLLADPRVRKLVQSIDQTIQQAIEKQEESELARAGYVLVKQLLTQPWCAFASDIKIMNPNLPPTGHVGVMICLDDKEEFEGSLDVILEKADIYNKTTTVEIDGKFFTSMPLPTGNLLTWGTISWKNKPLFLVGLGEGTVEAMLKRLDTPAPAWLTKLKKQIPVRQRVTTAYLNLKAVRKVVVPIIAKESRMKPEQVDKVIDALGLGNLKALQASSGLDKTGMVERVRLETDGPLQGVAAALVGSALNEKDLDVVPADANLLVAANLTPIDLYEGILAAANAVGPREGMAFEIQIRQMAKAIGFESIQELLKTIGQTWVVYNSTSEGGTFPTGLTLAVDVKDSFTKTRAGLENLLMMYHKNNPRFPKLNKKPHRGTEVCYLTFQDEPIPMAPGWCVKDGRLFVSFIPQNIFAVLDRNPKRFKPITTVPEVSKALAPKPVPMSLVYYDPKPIFQVIYPFIPYMANSVTSSLRKEEQINVDAFYVPSLPVLLPYVKPVIHTLRSTRSGLELESHSVLPGIFASSGSIPTLVALLLPARNSARVAARRMSSRNNMMQIMLTMLNYESAKGHFPPAYTVDKKGKPLLSWRVYLLPYLGESELYKQFHLDEPWDSPHNKKLIPMMPDTLRSPMSTAAHGMTTYLTVRTDKSVFPGKEKIRIGNISDGMSNTIAVVEANDKHAVIWTKPGDYVPDKDDPIKGLKGVYRRSFLAAFCDGSVHNLSINMPKNDFDAMVTHNGGEPVDVEMYEERR